MVKDISSVENLGMEGFLSYTNHSGCENDYVCLKLTGLYKSSEFDLMIIRENCKIIDVKHYLNENATIESYFGKGIKRSNFKLFFCVNNYHGSDI